MRNTGEIKLKICGMRHEENILAVAELFPDYMGFIFYEGSRRFVGKDFTIPAEFPSAIKRIGVFVNESTQEILRLADKHALDFIQLHGSESVEQCAEIRKKGLGVIKAFAVAQDFDFNNVLPFEKVVDYFLFDTKGKDFGGQGVPFDWNILKRYDQRVSFFLSGGISPVNVTGVSALKGMNLHALDVNSGVEQEVGIKDVELVKKLNNLKI